MTDATEDAIHIPTRQNDRDAASDSEDDDLPPDYLALGRSSMSKDGNGIPRRGMKDFESNTTNLQSRTLAMSRNAMWDTLRVVRVHQGTFFEKRTVKRISPKETKGVDKRNRANWTASAEYEEEHEEEVLTTVHGGTPIGIYNPETGITAIPKEHVRGGMFMRVGRDLSGGGVEMLPEEALWALEGSKLDIRYPDNFWNDHTTEIDSNEDLEFDDPRMPMSLQGAYAAFIGEEESRGGLLTPEKYVVFAALKRLGYIVLRSKEWSGGRHLSSLPDEQQNKQILSPATSLLAWLHGLVLSITRGKPETQATRFTRQRLGPLVTPGIYRSYADIFRLLSLVGSHDPSTISHIPQDIISMNTRPATANPFTTHWNVYKPPGSSRQWRKTCPGEPSFRISVVSARDTVLPNLAQLEALMAEQKPSVPMGVNIATSGTETYEKLKQNESIGAIYGRVKHGYKNVVLAIVDEGLVSYVRVADAGFVRERLYERVDIGRGGKGGGRGGGRGRGRGGRGRTGRG